MTSLLVCLDFAVEELIVSESFRCPALREFATHSTVPSIAVCFRDYAPILISAASGECLPRECTPGRVNFCGRGKAALFDVSREEVQSWVLKAPLWVLLVLHDSDSTCSGREQGPDLVLASVCLDLGANLSRAVARGPSISPGPYIRAAAELTTTTGTESHLILKYASRVSCVCSDAEIPRPMSDLMAPVQRLRPEALNDDVCFPMLSVKGSSYQTSPRRTSSPQASPLSSLVRSPIAGAQFLDELTFRNSGASPIAAQFSSLLDEARDGGCRSPVVAESIPFSWSFGRNVASEEGIRLERSIVSPKARGTNEQMVSSFEPSALPLVAEMTRELFLLPHSE